MVRKYLEPFREGVEYGPQISTWIRSKLGTETWVDEVNGSLFCLARGHTEQLERFLLSLKQETSGTMDFNKANLCEDA